MNTKEYNHEYYISHPELKIRAKRRMQQKRVEDPLYTYRKYCKDINKIENYDLASKDNFVGWDLHHRLELTINNEPALTRQDLIRHRMYYNRLYFELIFLQHGQHSMLHHLAKGEGLDFYNLYGVYPKENKKVYNRYRQAKYRKNVKAKP